MRVPASISPSLRTMRPSQARRAPAKSAELDQPVSEDFSEQAVEREGEEVLEDLGAAGQQEIRMIEAALDRIANGSYGTCVNCGDPIGDARLDVLPQAPRCRNCAN
jgi:RNA polymerase-binding transcription factor DksA